MQIQNSCARFVSVIGAAAFSGLCWSAPADAFCRTRTVPVAADFNPAPGHCWDQGVPLWWRNECVSYDIQRNASKKISYDAAAQAAAVAFSKWTGATCPTSGSGPSRASIDVRDLGPVDCDLVQYNKPETHQGNQHVILFRDDAWPYDDKNNTLALTTVSFDKVTGELYDADMEINTTLGISVGDPVPADGYDFASVLTHETGHFLGLAHSGDHQATMAAIYLQGSTIRRNLTQDDVNAICTVYPPDATRAVDTSVASSGKMPSQSCDPTPVNGFASECATPVKNASCSVGASREAASGSASPALAFASIGAIALLAKRRRPKADNAGHRGV